MDRAVFFSRRSLAFSCIFAMLINLVVLGGTPAFADAMTVNLETDGPDAFPGNGQCDTDLNNENGEQCTLRAAIMEANANAEPDTITVNVDDVVLTSTADADAGGDLDVMTDTAVTTIDGNGVVVVQNTEDRVFEVHPGSNATLIDLSLQEGEQGTGGGLYNEGETTLTAVTLVSNGALAGGGIFNAGVLRTSDTIIEGNFGLEAGGGLLNVGEALILDGNIGAEGSPNVSLFEGGGILNAGYMQVTGTAIQFNEAAEGGGVFNTGDTEGFDCCPMDFFPVFHGADIDVNDNVAEGESFVIFPAEEEVGAQDHEVDGGPHSHGEGGGIWNDGWLFLDESDITDNLAVSGTAEDDEGGEGGGIYNAGGVTQAAAATAIEDGSPCFWFVLGQIQLAGATGGGSCILDSTIDGNVAQGQPPEFAEPGFESDLAGKGGGIWNGFHSDGEGGGENGFMFVAGTDLISNDAALGGGVYNHDGALVVSESAVTDNFASDPVTGTAGGGAYLSGFTEELANPFLLPCFSSTCFYGTTFEGNESHAGGGMYVGTNEAAPIVQVDSNTFTENEATQGGAIWNDSFLDLENSTLSQNDATEYGGGLYNTCCPGEVSSTANTLYRNSAGIDGGNVFDNSFDTTEFFMTIIAGGSPFNCNTEVGFPNFDDAGWNLDNDGTCVGEGNGNIIGEAARLDSLNDNGGPTETHALLRDSPALDAVAFFACPPPDVDQRGENRPEDGTEDDNEGETPDAECDIGSFEHQEDENFPSTGGGGGSPTLAQCEDDIDNDGDGRIDESDEGCVDPDDNTEDSEGTPTPGPSPTGPSPSPSPTRPGGGGGGEVTNCVDAAEQLGRNLVSGTDDDDVLRGTAGPDVICAKDGNDEVYALGGNDIIWLGPGDDYVVGGAGADIVRGGPGQDLAEGNRGNDEMTLGHGPDLAQGGTGNDQLYGRQQNDDLFGGAGNDGLFGGPGQDNCNGGPGTDTQTSC